MSNRHPYCHSHNCFFKHIRIQVEGEDYDDKGVNGPCNCLNYLHPSQRRYVNRLKFEHELFVMHHKLETENNQDKEVNNG